MKKFLLIIFILIVVIPSIFSFYAYTLLNRKVDTDDIIVLHISKDMTIYGALDMLNQQGLLQPRFLFKTVIKYYAKNTGAKLFVGTHTFSPELTNWELINQLLRNEGMRSIKVTFPEGITIKTFAKIVSNNLNLDSAAFVELCNSSNFINELGTEVTTLEGLLKPSTYFFSEGTSIEQVIKTLYTEQSKVIQSFDSLFKLCSLSWYELLTLASIIEAETPVINERKKISGVYHNRLKANMPLGADPTIQYALPHRKKRLLYSDLEINSPYNTYKNTGLPPTPINSPSISSIEAAILPEKHNYHYFVAKGDGSNEHNFATNYKEHLTNKKIFDNNRKNK